jgi:hypothetical protein
MTKCPKCGYERKQIDEIINAAECPQCGIIYEKWKPTAVTENDEPIKKASETLLTEPTNIQPSKINPILKYVFVITFAIFIINSYLVPFIIKYSQKEKTETKKVVETPSASLQESLGNDKMKNVPETKLPGNYLINIPQREQEEPYIVTTKVTRLVTFENRGVAESGSLKTHSKHNVYCYVDSEWLVHFVDWNAGILISKPDGRLDNAKYENWVIDQIGSDPFLIDSEKEAQVALDQNRDKLFKNNFPNKSAGEKDLTIGEQQSWEDIKKAYYTNTYNESVARRNTAVGRYNSMIQQFNKYSSSR